MNTNAKKSTDSSTSTQTTFNIQVCSKDGRLLSEYALTQKEHNVSTISAAESCACESLSDYEGEPLVIVVSEETLTKLRQVQTDCETGKKRSVWQTD